MKNIKRKKQSHKRKRSEEFKKKWTVEDTKVLYPTLTEEEAKMAWEMGW